MNVYDEFQGYDVNVYDSVLIIGLIVLAVIAFFVIYTYPISVNLKRLIPSLNWDGFRNKNNNSKKLRNKGKKINQPSREGFISGSFSYY